MYSKETGVERSGGIKQAIPQGAPGFFFVPKKSLNKNFNMVALQTIKRNLISVSLLFEEAFQVALAKTFALWRVLFFIVRNSLLVSNNTLIRVNWLEEGFAT